MAAIRWYTMAENWWGIMATTHWYTLTRYLTNVLVWMDKIYTQRNSGNLGAFFSELFHSNSRIPFYSQASVLDRYISSSNPKDTPVALTAILRLLHNQPELRSYFFRSKPDPAWVAILWENDFFKTPPPYEPEIIRWGPRWDVQFYLLSVADQVPDFVVKHFKSISIETWHSWYISQAIEALYYIPPDKILPLVPQIISWLEDPQLTFTIAPSVFRLAKKLAQNIKMAAFDLFSALVEPIPTSDTETGLPIFSKFEGRTLEREALLQVLGLLSALNIQRLVAILEEQLCVSLRFEASLMRRPNFEFSGRWRKTIADDEFEQREGIHSKYTEWDYKNRLLRMLRDALRGWVEQDAGAVRALLERYLVDPHQILRRLALFLLCQFPTSFPSLVLGELGWQDDVFADPPPYERLLLLKAGYPLLDSEAKESLIVTICAGPSPQYLADARKHLEQRSLEQADEHIQAEADKWKLDKLWMLQDYLTGEPKDLLDRLVNVRGIPRYAISSSTELAPVEYKSPLTEEEIAQMSPDELLDFLKQWDPTPKITRLIRIWHKVLRIWRRFLHLLRNRISAFDNLVEGSSKLPGRDMQDSYEVLAGSIARTVVSNPHKYRSRLVAIASHNPRIAYALLNHFININNSPSIPWPICLDLCEGLLKDRYIQRDMTPVFGGGWANVRRSIVRLLEVGLGETERAIPFEYLHRSKDILCLLVDDPDPLPESDNPPSNYVGHNDPLHVAINHVRPIALSALIDFAYRNAILARQMQALSEDDVKGHGPNRLGRDVQTTLTRKLDRRADPSWAVHSVYGRRLITLHWLNFEWTTAHIDQIFPGDNDVQSIKYFMAAWDSFVVSHHHYGCKEMLELLRPKYVKAINNLSQGHTTQTHINPAQGLARHVAWEYLMSDYDLHSPAFHESLIFFFYQNVPVDAAGNLAWFFWRVCAENKEQRDRYWLRVRDLWEWRNEIAITTNNSSDFDQEMKYFANLPLHAPASESIVTLRPLLDGFLPHITRTPEGNLGQDAIEEYLLQEVSRYPVETIDYYQQIRNSVVSPQWFIYSRGEKLRKILETAADNPLSRQHTLNLIQSFPRLGVHKYDDIYYKYAG